MNPILSCFGDWHWPTRPSRDWSPAVETHLDVHPAPSGVTGSTWHPDSREPASTGAVSWQSAWCGRGPSKNAGFTRLDPWKNGDVTQENRVQATKNIWLNRQKCWLSCQTWEYLVGQWIDLNDNTLKTMVPRNHRQLTTQRANLIPLVERRIMCENALHLMV